jgi:hypothetical protein
MARKGKPPPKPAARPPRAQPTLGQATGGRPGRVPPARPPTAPRLGAGLNLNPRQRGRFQQAVQGGQGQQFMTDRPWLQQRINQLDPRSQQATNLQNFLGTGQPQPRPTTGPGVPAPTPQPPTAAPPMGGWTGDNAAMQPGLAGAAGGPYAIGSGEMGPSFGPGGPYGGVQPMSGYGGNAYAIGSGEMGPSFGPGGPYGGYQPRDLGDLHGMLGGGPAMQPQQQQRPGGMFGGYSPQMQQVLQARGYGAGGGGMGGGLANLGGGGGFTGGNRGAGGLFGPYAGPVQQRRPPPTGGAGAAGGTGGVGGAGGTL